MRWLNCTKREEYPPRRRRRRRLVCLEHTPPCREKSAPPGFYLSVFVHHRVCLSHCVNELCVRASAGFVTVHR